MSRPLRRSRAASVVLVIVGLSGCAAERADTDATHAYRRFQTAVRDSDREALRELLTAESFPAIDDVLAAGARGSQDMVVDEARSRSSGRVDLVLVDPAASGSRGVCVIVRDGGRWRVDLVESAIASHGATTGAGFDIRQGADPTAVQDAVIRHEAGTR